MAYKTKIFVDLDGTLTRTYDIASLHRNKPLLEACVPIAGGMVSVLRPGALEFLGSLSEIADVCLFTAASADYAESVVEATGIRRHLLAVHSSGDENPHSVADLYGLQACPWFLVEDTPADNQLTIYKLQCLGLTNGREYSQVVVSHRVVTVRSYRPREEPQSDLDLGRALEDISRRIRRPIF